MPKIEVNEKLVFNLLDKKYDYETTKLIGLGVQAEHVANAKDNFIEAEVLNEQDS